MTAITGASAGSPAALEVRPSPTAGPATVVHRGRGALTDAERVALAALLRSAAPALHRAADPDIGTLATGAQHSLLAVTPHGTVGALLFRPAVVHPRFRDRGPCVYATAVVVREGDRRTGVGRLLLDRLGDLMAQPTTPLATRLPARLLTVAAADDVAHLALLRSAGLAEVDRATGPDGDVVYLAREASSPVR